MLIAEDVYVDRSEHFHNEAILGDRKKLGRRCTSAALLAFCESPGSIYVLEAVLNSRLKIGNKS